MTRDTITEPARRAVLFDRAQRRALDAGQPAPAPTRPGLARVRLWLHSLVTCDWCTGLWVSAVVGGLSHVSRGATWFRLPALVLTAAHAVGWLASHEPDDDE